MKLADVLSSKEHWCRGYFYLFNGMASSATEIKERLTKDKNADYKCCLIGAIAITMEKGNIPALAFNKMADICCKHLQKIDSKNPLNMYEHSIQTYNDEFFNWEDIEAVVAEYDSQSARASENE